MSDLAVERVSKDYGTVLALDDVSLSVDPGELHCLAGPNGSGKSTLFRVFLGLTSPTSGEVARPPSGQLGTSFQEPAFYPSLTVGENIEVFRGLAGNPDLEWVRRVVRVFNLPKVLERQAGDLSGGYSKQLDLALGLLNEPEYLLLDEPLTDLDDVTTESLLSFLESYADAGNAVLVSSHRIAEFAATLDRLTVMDGGRVVYDERREAIDGVGPKQIERVYRRAIAERRD
ncbi:ABC transporter ATP-binding protein [Halapricum salinum]|uniref:ABC transporter ATP-binding protein n=1 Tax=Halapricum salinum TaxID=1457250 RepID=A0A4D6HD28_9EURY|nr:ABC transporter ATP-binding protein [Halapricum salinum]QCC51879.1 ABC transporter ATP-binding protein [Halapricum salinum]